MPSSVLSATITTSLSDAMLAETFSREVCEALEFKLGLWEDYFSMESDLSLKVQKKLFHLLNI